MKKFIDKLHAHAWKWIFYFLTPTSMSYHIEVVLFGALLLLFSLRRKRRPHKQRGGTLVFMAILIEFLLITVGIAALFSGLFLDVNIDINIADILSKYTPLFH
ncbi:MAG: hypothetical protein COU31_02240 [Candidatus Magasanikbacteria bacterium CG10_big_fil_rev_8_21_14_0_10_40_10]|uniref:Uncharacterized protein n=1 Tax=Candidatus Magasanikbacteria bacterium CG10_big_fil_rev_8_21_14_0_10_40_10 TaxID=1974648 RepID=A0A2M6W438_9BACT|nr:MAG: hypothetical protein COU31_02240 [Candidatus Magasanikbacteria bacterium CG10_big_fil_rev_8_21_14_0_10_40_10]